MNAKPKVLCMTDLSLIPEAVELLKEETDVDFRPGDREELLATIHN